MKDLELAIKELIEQMYDCKYKGSIKVSELMHEDPNYWSPVHAGYKVEIGLNKQEKPIELAIDGNKQQFLDFVKSELKKNRYNYIEFFDAERLYFSVGCCEQG